MEVRDAITDDFPQDEIRKPWISLIVAIIGRLVTPEWNVFPRNENRLRTWKDT
jgi:hypothetical protein